MSNTTNNNIQLPKRWEVKKLGEVSSFSQGIQVGLKEHLTYPKDGYVRFIRIVDYTQNTDDIRYVPNPGEKYFVNEDDIVMVRYGTPGLIGRGKSGVIANNLFKIKIEIENLSNDYLSLYLSQYKIQKYLSTQGSATMPALNFGQLKTVIIQYPKSLEEQKRIVSLLDRVFEQIDRAKAIAEQNLNNAKEIFESYLNRVFDNGKLLVVNGEWEERVIKELGKVQTGSTPPTKDKSNFGDFIPFAKPPHFKPNGEIETGESMLSEQGAKKGRVFGNNSILMVCIGATIGKTGFSKNVISSNQQINALTPFKDYEPRFFYYAFISESVQKQVLKQGKSAQATLPIINKSKWENILVWFPKSIQTQKQIVAQLDKLQAETKKLEAVYQNKIANLEELKKSVLERAFRGEL